MENSGVMSSGARFGRIGRGGAHSDGTIDLEYEHDSAADHNNNPHPTTPSRPLTQHEIEMMELENAIQAGLKGGEDGDEGDDENEEFNHNEYTIQITQNTQINNSNTSTKSSSSSSSSNNKNHKNALNNANNNSLSKMKLNKAPLSDAQQDEDEDALEF